MKAQWVLLGLLMDGVLSGMCQKLEEFALCTLPEQEEIETVAKKQEIYRNCSKKPGRGGL